MNFMDLLKGFADDPNQTSGQGDLAALMQSLGIGPQAQAAAPPQAAPGQAVPPVLDPNAVDPNDPNQNIVLNAKTPMGGPRAGATDSSEAIPGIGNTSAVQDIAEANKNSQAAAGHKGMFGLKGTLRDVLGTLGDAFLVQSGHKEAYAPQREQEKIGDALAGFTQNPEAAASRLTGLGNTDANNTATELQKNSVQQKILAAQQIQAQRVARQKAMLTATQTRGALLSSLDAIKDPTARAAAYDKLKPQLEAINEEAPVPFDIPDKYDPDAIAQGSRAGINAYRQATLQQGSARQAETERSHRANEGFAATRASNDTKRANRATAGRAAPNPTDTSIAADALGRIARNEAPLPGDAALLKATGHGPNRGRKPSAMEALGIGGSSSPTPTKTHTPNSIVYKADGSKWRVSADGKSATPTK